MVESATLVAVTCTMSGEGKSAGAVKVPEVVIVPAEELPPATPFTLQVTAVFVVLATMSVKASEFPSKTEELDGEMLTAIEGEVGGGGGGTVADPPPPHPISHKLENRSCSASNASALLCVIVEMRPLVSISKCERGGRMPGGMQAKGQRKLRQELRICGGRSVGPEWP